MFTCNQNVTELRFQNPEETDSSRNDKGSAGINSHHLHRPQDVMIPKVTCPDAGLPFKHCSSVYAILSALFPGQNVSLIGNSINSHEFTGNTILSKKDIVSLTSLQDTPLYSICTHTF